MNVKGSALSARVRYVQERGVPAYARFLNALSSTTRVKVEAGFDADAWYPFETFIEICEVIDRLHGTGDLNLCFELGRYACDANLKTLYRFLFRVGNIQFILRRAQAAWHIHYDEGELVLVEETPSSARLVIEGIEKPHRAHCLSVLGWIARAGELSGKRIVQVHERCRLLGAERCEVGIDWE